MGSVSGDSYMNDSWFKTVVKSPKESTSLFKQGGEFNSPQASISQFSAISMSDKAEMKTENDFRSETNQSSQY